MKSFFKIVLLSFVFVSSFAFAGTRAEKLNQLFSEYNKRFVAGKYVSNSTQVSQFNSLQDAVALQFKKEQALMPLLLITNDFDTSLSVQLYLLLDENNSLVGFFYEKSNYYDEEERSYLRFKLMPEIEKGLGFVSVNGTYALQVKGFYFKPETGGTLQFGYLTDLKAKSVSAINLFILKKNNTWGAYNELYQLVHQADVKTWSSFFPPNGGVTQILLK